VQYLFGDSDIAAQRLQLLAQLFAEPTRVFLREAGVGKRGLVLDLGCGPGYSTHFLAEVLECDRVVGLDNSEHFISLARKTKTKKVSFHLHDVALVPFPVGLADVIFCRFLLTHMRQPLAVVGEWATQLTPGGLLMMEEVGSISTTKDVFATYMGMVEAMLAHQANRLYMGPVLNNMHDTDSLKRQTSRLRRLKVPTEEAATLFYLNLQNWKHRAFVKTHYSEAAIEELEEELKSLTQEPSGKREIEWGLRQVAFERI